MAQGRGWECGRKLKQCWEGRAWVAGGMGFSRSEEKRLNYKGGRVEGGGRQWGAGGRVKEQKVEGGIEIERVSGGQERQVRP